MVNNMIALLLQVPTLLALSDSSRTTAGVLLVTIVGIAYGGTFVLKLVRGQQAATPFQLAFSRAGHAHAGVLVILGLVCQILVDAAQMDGVFGVLARNGVPLAAILMPAGFFFSSMGKEITQPNRFIWLLYLGIVPLTLGVLSLGIGLLVG